MTNFADETQKKIDGIFEQTVGLTAVTLGWAVRAEMVRDDVEDVQEYMQELAKRPGVRTALVAGKNGLVIAASDQGNRGRPFAHVVTDPPAETPKTQILARPDGVLRLVIPIMGLDARIGTLLLDYERPLLAAIPRDV